MGLTILAFYLGYGYNNGQHPEYWISAGKKSGFIAANFCINKQKLSDIQQWFANNKQNIDRKFDEEFEEKPDRPPNRYVVVGVARKSNGESEYTSEFEWFRERLEKLERLCQGTHNLKVGACASSRLRFSQRVHRLTVAPL